MQKNIFSWISKDLIGFSLTSLFNDFSHEMTTALLPSFVQEIAGTKHAPIALGIITGTADALSTVMKLISGWLSQRITFFKPVLLVGYSLTPLFVGIIGTAHYIWQIFIYQTIAWMGRGLREPMRDVWLSNISDARDYGKIFGMQRAFDTIGAIAGPLLAFFVIKIISIRNSFFIALIPGAFSVLSLLFLTSNYQKKSMSNHKKEFFLQQLKNLPTRFHYFVFVMFVFGIGNFHKTLLIFRAQEMLIGHSSTSLLATSSAIALYALFNMVRACAEFVIGFLSDYSDRRILLTFFGFIFFAITNGMLLFQSTNILFWIIIFIFAGCSLGTVTSLEKSYAAQLLPEEHRGIGFGFLQSVDGIGDLFSSALVGLLWSYFGAPFAFAYALICSIAASIFFILERYFFNDPHTRT